jgi:hypothetical protein
MNATVAENNSEEREQKERKDLGALRAVGRQHFAPIMRTPCGPPGKGIDLFKYSTISNFTPILVTFSDTTPFGRKNGPLRETFKVFGEDQITTSRQEYAAHQNSHQKSEVALEFADDPEFQVFCWLFIS